MSPDTELDLSGLRPEIAGAVGPFFTEIIEGAGGQIHSLYVVGSALTEDYHAGRSDINSIVVLKKMDMCFLKFLSKMGKRHSKKKISAPLVMTPGYIEDSIDVFPLEFLNFRLIHKRVHGADLLGGLEISRHDIRYQCERELKVRLIGLRQGYISSMGGLEALNEGIFRSVKTYIPLFRGMIYMLGAEPPVARQDVLSKLSGLTGVDTSMFSKVHAAHMESGRKRKKFSHEELETAFEHFYEATERLGDIADETKI
ncbi:MAG: hypothetical protein M0Z59_06195 [Nitrospiraceae bacterium]|nr:hypothetical protein [Nitrospiraceae bacterium]